MQNSNKATLVFCLIECANFIQKYLISKITNYMQKKNADIHLHSFTKLKTKLKFMLDYEFSERYKSSNDVVFFTAAILVLFDWMFVLVATNCDMLTLATLPITAL